MWRHLTMAIICILQRQKKSMSYCFISKWNHVQKNHTCQFFSYFFFCHICRTTVCQKSRYYGNVTKRLLFTVGKIRIKTYKLNRSIWFYASTMSRILSRENDDSVGLRYLIKGCSCGLSRLTGLARLTKNFFCKKFNMSIWI